MLVSKSSLTGQLQSINRDLRGPSSNEFGGDPPIALTRRTDSAAIDGSLISSPWIVPSIFYYWMPRQFLAASRWP
ncbi:hypothetical protein OKW50_001050 [Paraburkholderia youngii]|uniref:Uncharacterized protein n=1 Tax=Paraburkholderia youngii TaxID=2782701 RepID=A0A7W8L8V3_9BURK|nr:hypothetical protein [Paraburkholderia youngii]